MKTSRIVANTITKIRCNTIARKAITEELANKLKYSNELMLAKIKLEVLLAHRATSCKINFQTHQAEHCKKYMQPVVHIVDGSVQIIQMLRWLGYRRSGLVTYAESIMTVVHVKHRHMSCCSGD